MGKRMTFADELLTTLATPRPREPHLVNTIRNNGYLLSDCSCKAYMESKGYDESSRNATAFWALEHGKEGTN